MRWRAAALQRSMHALMRALSTRSRLMIIKHASIRTSRTCKNVRKVAFSWKQTGACTTISLPGINNAPIPQRQPKVLIPQVPPKALIPLTQPKQPHHSSQREQHRQHHNQRHRRCQRQYRQHPRQRHRCQREFRHHHKKPSSKVIPNRRLMRDQHKHRYLSSSPRSPRGGHATHQRRARRIAANIAKLPELLRKA